MANSNTRTFDSLLDRVRAQREAENNAPVNYTEETGLVKVEVHDNGDGTQDERVIDAQPEISDEDKPVVRLTEDILNDPNLSAEEKLDALKDAEYTQDVEPETNDVEAVVTSEGNDYEQRLG